MAKNTLLASVPAPLLHEALGRGVRIAPNKGAAYDRAAGFHLSFIGNDLHVRVTDLEHSFYQRIPVVVHDVSEHHTFRVPTTLQKFVSTLPMGDDKVIRFWYDPDRRRIIAQYNKAPTRLTMPMIVGEYPLIEWYDYSSMDDASELAQKIEAVSWAIDDAASGVISGLRIDGVWLEAMSSKNAARIKCSSANPEAVTAVVKKLVGILKTGSEVRMMTMSGRIVIALDDAAQVSSSTVLGPWPNMMERLGTIDLVNRFTINKQRLLDGLGRIIACVGSDRFPRVTFQILSDRVVMALVDKSNGDITDACQLIDRDGPAVDTIFMFQPAWLEKAITTFPGSTVTVSYLDAKHPIQLTEPSTSYEAWITSLRSDEQAPESPKDDE